MIYSYSVYEILLDVIRKDKRGRSLSPEEYNNIAPLVNDSVFSKYYSKFEESPESSNTMGAFRVMADSIPIVAGIGTLPADYYAMSGSPYYTDAGGTVRYLDLVSDAEYAWRQQDYLTQASLTYPVYRLGTASSAGDMQIYVTPATGITPIVIDYIRVPNVPFLDYYVNDTTLLYTWMGEGVVVAVPSGSTARDETAGAANVASLTVNWEFENEDLPLIINLFLKYMGINLPSPELFEGGTVLEDKQDSQ